MLWRELLDRQTSAYWRARAPAVFRALAARGDERILEIGCGSGLWSTPLAERAAYVVAIDVDHAQVRRAVARSRVSFDRWGRFGARRASPIGFLVATAESLPLRANSVERAVCIDVLENIPDDRAAVAELARVLRPGGRSVITVLLTGRWSPFDLLAFDEYVRDYRVDEVGQLLTQAGLTVKEQFTFYRRFATLARAGQIAVTRSKATTWPPGVRTMLWCALAALIPLDRLSRMRAGGVGFVALKR